MGRSQDFMVGVATSPRRSKKSSGDNRFRLLSVTLFVGLFLFVVYVFFRL